LGDVVAEEIVPKTGVDLLMKNETQLQKSPLINQISKELGDGNSNHKIKKPNNQNKKHIKTRESSKIKGRTRC
jgi:hypothetical protein